MVLVLFKISTREILYNLLLAVHVFLYDDEASFQFVWTDNVIYRLDNNNYINNPSI